MCNAWNHPRDCNCGWGGDGNFGGYVGYGRYGGVGSGGGYSTFRSTSEGEVFEFPFITYPSYVNPNAQCPVCGASVYFYQSPYGGRVFFDELGPPWPKHPCTDNPVMRDHFSSVESRARFLVGSVTRSSESDSEAVECNESTTVKASIPVREIPRLAAWAEAGWLPFIVTSIVPRSIGIEAEGKLFVSSGTEVLSFRILQSSVDAQFFRNQGQIRIGYSLVLNASTILSVLNESPILLKKDPDLHKLTLSSFILTPDGEVEEITLSVIGIEESLTTS
ncbi:MAG: hypothetical protein K0Q55_1878 [Verrucomicrobia bacterium]|jgi:hypothetical protein|nr:hypothetical protein [Verrucomicrobiota bacterium]